MEGGPKAVKSICLRLPTTWDPQQERFIMEDSGQIMSFIQNGRINSAQMNGRY